MFNFFGGNRGSQNNWDKTISKIDLGLNYVRSSWFTTLIEFLEQMNLDNKEEKYKIPIANNILAGSGLYAVQAYQLIMVSMILAKKLYIDESEGRDFMDELYSKVCGSSLWQVEDYAKRYYEVISDQSAFNFRFVHDIAGYFTQKEVSTPYTVPVITFLPVLKFGSQCVVAETFDDKLTLMELRAKMRST